MLATRCFKLECVLGLVLAVGTTDQSMNVRLDGIIESVPLALPVLREPCEKTLPSFNVPLRTSARYTTERQPASQTLAEPVAHNPSPFRQCHPAGKFVCIRSF